MKSQYYEDNKDDVKEVSIEPVVLTNVKIRTIEKTVIDPKLVPVDIEVPKYIPKDTWEYIRQEKPTIFYVKEEKPYTIDIPVPVEVPYDVSVPVLKEEPFVVKVPVLKEKPYTVDVPIPNEVPYDLPVVSMEKVNQIASEAVSTLKTAKSLLEDVTTMAGVLSRATVEFNNTITNLKSKIDEVKNYKIVEEDLVVKVPKLQYETKHVIGKIIARGE